MFAHIFYDKKPFFNAFTLFFSYYFLLILSNWPLKSTKVLDKSVKYAIICLSANTENIILKGEKTMKKILAAVLATLMAVTILAGCGPKEPVETGDALGLVLMQASGTPYNANPDSPISKAMIEKTGVYIKEVIIADPNAMDLSKINLAFSTGDVPDLVKFDQMSPNSSTTYNKLKDESQFVDVSQYITDEMPNLQKLTSDKTMYSNLNVVAGTDPLYAIPYGFPLSNDDIVYDGGGGITWAREDWLKAVGVDAGDIVTMEDYGNLLQKFKDEIPDVNGLPIIPSILGGAGGNWPEAAKQYASPWFWMQEDGTMNTQHYHEWYVKSMEFLAHCYSTGLLDKESYTQQQDMVDEKITTGRVGCYVANIKDMVEKYNPILAETVPGARFVPLYNMLYGKMVDERMEPESGVFYQQVNMKAYTCITNKVVDDGNIEKVLKFLDFIASEEGQLLVNLGVEGETWEKVDGKPALKKEIYDVYASDQLGNAMTQYGLDSYALAGYDMHYEITGGDKYNWQYEDAESEYNKFAKLVCRELRPTPTPDVTNFVLQMPTFQSVVADKVYEVMTPLQNEALTASSGAEGKALAEKVIQAGRDLGLTEFLDEAAKGYTEFASQFK